MTSVLAIDQSTSATKTLLFRIDGSLIDHVTVDHHQHYPQPGWVEHDAEEIYRNTIRAIYRLTGSQVFATDHTNACRTLLLNIHTLRWDEGLCDLLGVPSAAPGRSP